MWCSSSLSVPMVFFLLRTERTQRCQAKELSDWAEQLDGEALKDDNGTALCDAAVVGTDV